MKKSTGILISSICLTLLIPFVSYAGTWQENNGQWSYQNDDGTYLKNSWITDNGVQYYLDSNGNMLTEDLAPDGRLVGRDGKLLTDSEQLPSVFSGSESEYNAFYREYSAYSDGFDKTFNADFDIVLDTALHVIDTKNFESALAGITKLRTIDFTPYLTSSNFAIRKHAMQSEIFRIQQIHYLTELVEAAKAEDYDRFDAICNKLNASVDEYANALISLINHLRVLDNF